MNITDVRVSLIDGSDDQLLAFCTITFDRAFVVRDIRVINGANGPFVAMPSRRVTTNCGRCGSKNYLGSKFCAECGAKVQPISEARMPERSRGYIDIAHPINAKARETLQKHVIAAYQREIEKSERPDYQPTRFESETLGDQQQSSQEESLPHTTKPSPHWPHKNSTRDSTATPANRVNTEIPNDDSRED